MDMEQSLKDQDINLMPRASKVTPQSSPPPESQPVPSKQGEVFLLNGDPKTDVYDMAFDKSL